MAKGTTATAAAQKRAEPDTKAIGKQISKDNAPDSAVVQSLQQQVANAFILYSNYKHYHWQTFGPLFRDLHLLFDEFAKEVLDTMDEFAERVRMIGQNPVSAPLEVVSAASVKVAEREGTMRAMIEEADGNLLVVIQEMREAARIADGANDPGTNDLFARTVQIHEKHEWWLRDILKKHDELAT
jgi:starvation-inducible DNA-binding protein